MFSTTLKQFKSGDCPVGEPTDCKANNYELYVVKNLSNEILYIGISQANIWDRWFGSRGRLRTYLSGYWCDSISREFIENLPESWNWIIDLYTFWDCARTVKLPDYIKVSLEELYYYNGIKDFERAMIEKYHPKLNVIYNDRL